MNEESIRAATGSLFHRLKSCFRTALPGALKSAGWLLTIMIPVSFGVAVLKWSGILQSVSGVLSPAFRLLGLPGQAALVFLTSIALNIYSAIAVIATLELSSRSVTILALMCLISHNFFVEAAVQKRTGSSLTRMIVMRLFWSVAGALILNALLPGSPRPEAAAPVMEGGTAAFWPVLSAWAVDTFGLVLKVVVLVSALMVLQRILQEFGIIRLLTKLFYPLLRLLGLPRETSFLWIVANTLGLAYGSAVMIEESDSGRLSRRDADLLNHHIGISHSLLEDTLLFVAIGVPAFWITIPRIALAAVSVWERRLELKVTRGAESDRKAA